MKYIEATVDGVPMHLSVMKETPQDDGTVKVLVLAAGGARSLFVDPADVKAKHAPGCTFVGTPNPEVCGCHV